LCDDVAQYGVPLLAKLLEQNEKVGDVCQKYGFCDAPDSNVPDPYAVPSFVVNLDLPPAQRWLPVVRDPKIRAGILKVLGVVKTYMPIFVDDALDVIGRMVYDSFTPEYQGELDGIASELGADVLLLSVAQIAYELTDCTSIVAHDSNGVIHHVRNLDFGEGMGFTNVLRNLTAHVEFQRGGKPLYEAGVFGGYIGVLSGMMPSGFSVSVDTRYLGGNLYSAYFEMLRIAILNGKKVYDVGHMVRMTFETQSTFAGAVSVLSNTPMVGDVYYIVGGLKAPGPLRCFDCFPVSRHRLCVARWRDPRSQRNWRATCNSLCVCVCVCVGINFTSRWACVFLHGTLWRAGN
jgi:hypothetical protein